MKNPTVRLAIRAVFAGLLAFLSSVQTAGGADSLNSGDWINAALWGLGAAVGLAAAEFGTPLNPLVGVGKSDGGTS